MKQTLLCLLIGLTLQCKRRDTENHTAEFIVNTSMEIAGADHIGASKIEFDFRDKHYTALRDNGEFQLERQFFDSTSVSVSKVRDVLNNTGFQRFVDDKPIVLPDTLEAKYAASVNSVHYFSVLPYGLNDRAVIKERLSDIEIKGKPYYTIKVTFNKDGGGEDFEDIFMYWIHIETFKVDYLAYSYNEDDSQGLRFRAAYNERITKGIRFVDYKNYRTKKKAVALNELPKLFEKEQLELLSVIELKNLSVN